MKTRLRERLNLLTLLWGLLSLSILTSCATKEDPCSIDLSKRIDHSLDGGKTLAALRERGSLKVGFSGFIPWAMKNTNDEWVGFEIDVAKKLARDLGLELEMVPTAWGRIIPALLNDEFDIIIAGMSVTPQRAKEVTFSDPYEYSKMVLLLNSRIQASSLRELNQPAYRFVGWVGSTPLTLTELLLNRAQTIAFDNNGFPAQALASGQAEGFVTTSVEAAIHIESYPDSIYAPDWGLELAKDDVAFALPLNVETAWLEYLNQWIETNWENGFLEEKDLYWFASRAWTEDNQVAQ